MNRVNNYQRTADGAVERFLTGEDEDLHRVAMATQQAEVSFELFLQMKNRAIEAYQEMMRLQVRWQLVIRHGLARTVEVACRQPGLKQRVSLVVAAVAVVAALVTFLQWREKESYQVLYSGLAAEDAAQVVARLKEAGAEYKLEQDGAIIKVRSERIADLRLQLAATGVPKTGRMGFELFDQNNFGATQFA